jgi:CheY-like chemotaxis protein
MSRVLVVEDNVMNRALFRDVLRHRGHVVVEAQTMDEARAELAGEPPDVILLDIQIPGGSGELLLQEIRRDQRLVAVPVVAVTAYAMRGDRERFLALGFDGYMSKPIDTRTFAAEVESHLREKP